MRALLILLFPVITFSQQTNMKCLTGTFGFKQAAAQRVLVDKIVKLSSSTWGMPITLSSFTLVSVGTTPAIYHVSFDDIRINIKDTRFNNLLSFATTYMNDNGSLIQYYYLKVHDCHLDTDKMCVVTGEWRK